MNANSFVGLLFATIVGLKTGAAEAGPVQAPDSVPLTPSLVNTLAEEMRRHHPALQSSEALARAARLGAEAVRVWDDPTLRLGAQAADQAMRADEGDLLYGVEQKLPLFGKPKAARQVADADAATARASAVLRFQALRRDLAVALFKAALADRVVEIGAQDREWLITMVAATEARYRVGQSPLVQLVQVQNELARRTNQLRTDLQLRANARVLLNRLLNRDLQAPWPRLELPPPAEPVPYSERLANLSVRHEPKSAVLREQIRQAQATVEVSRRARYPDVGLEFEGRNYTGNGEFRQGLFFLTFSLPLGNAAKYRRDVQREEERLRASRLDLADQELSARQEIHQLTVVIEAARREALLYRDVILPRSEEALASAQAEWESGRGSFRDLLDAHRMVLEGRLMFARAVAEQWQMLSELVLCCGLGDLEALLMLHPQSGPSPSESQPPSTP
jgi:outer membrane protein TolC